jgi:nucleoside-diphosphate-sugar epimerase
LQPRFFYGSCKHSLNVFLQGLSKLTGVSSAWARIFLLYGPHEPPQRLVPSIIAALLAGKPALCRSPHLQRDLLHVRDIAAALVATLESNVQGPLNLGSGAAVELGEVARKLAEIVGRPDLLELSTTARSDSAAEPLVLRPDTTRLNQEVGWRPKYSLESGLASTVKWWREHTPAVQEDRP